MKIICTQENLIKGLSMIIRSCGKNINLPILSNILFEAKKEGIKLSATNLELGATCQIRGKVLEKGEITIPAQLFFNYILNLPQEKIHITLSKDTLNITCKDYQSKIKGTEASDFPLIPEIKKDPFCIIKSLDLKKSLAQVIFAVAPSDIRPEISGVLIKLAFTKNHIPRLKLVATDGFRLAEKTITPKKIDSKIIKEKMEMIIPAQTIQELIRLLDEEINEVKISVSENQIKFAFTTDTEQTIGLNAELFSKLIDEKYPDYEKIFPEKFSSKATVETNDFIHALKSASLFSQKDSNEVELDINPTKNEIEVQAQSDRCGSSISRVKGKVEGDTEKIVFNYRYLLDGLLNLGNPRAKLFFSGSQGPGMIKPQDNDDYVYLVMPITKEEEKV